MRYSSCLIIFVALRWTFSSISYVSFVLESPELDPALQIHLTSDEWRGKITSFDLLAMCFTAVHLLCCKGTLLSHDQFGVYPHVLLWRIAFQPVHSQYLAGIVPPQEKDLAFPFTELHEILLSLLVQPVQVPLNGSTTIWFANDSSQLYIICKVGKSALYLSATVTTTFLTSTVSNINTWHTPLGNGLQLDIVLLIPMLWAQKFTQISVQLSVRLSSPYFINKSRRILRETVSKDSLTTR